MPVQGPQQPGFFLPGAEYMNLSPNAHIALQGRRRLQQQTALTNVPPGIANIGGTVHLETGMTDNSGIFLAWFELVYSPGLPLGAMAITAVTATLSCGPGSGLDLGYPVLTTPEPTTGVTVLVERDRFIPQRDVMMGAGNNGLLDLDFNISVTNHETATTLTAVAVAKIIYHRLDGIIE